MTITLRCRLVVYFVSNLRVPLLFDKKLQKISENKYLRVALRMYL